MKRAKAQLVGLHYRQGKACHWCGVTMRHPGSHKSERGKKAPPNLCTIDHLDSRLSPDRGKHEGKYRRVAACWKCNHERARAEEAALPREELWRRSGSYPVKSGVNR